MGTKIWERYFLRETAKILFLILFTFYGLYVLIDYSTHASNLHAHLPWRAVGFYYLCECIRRLDVLLPFALLIATIKTLTSLTMNHELVALMANGINLKTLLRPFVFVGLLSTFLVYVNTEFLLPSSLSKLNSIEQTYMSKKHKHTQSTAGQYVSLEDGTTLLFQRYDAEMDLFFDAYWIRSGDELYRIKFLYPLPETPRGEFVDHLARLPSGELVVQDSHVALLLPEMRFNKKKLLETLSDPEEQSLSQLWAKLPSNQETMSDKESQIASSFHYKLALPWLCLLAVIAPAPFCVRFTRQFPLFFVYAGCLFGLVALYLIMSAALVLGNRQVLPPFWAITTPFATFFGIFLWRFVRMQ